MEQIDITFFTPQPLMVDGEGFPLFGVVHLIYLAYAVTLIVILAVAYRRMQSGCAWGSARRTMLLVVAGIPLVLLVSQDVIMAQAGVFGAQWWPLHSCNICEYLAFVYALRPNRFCGEVIFTLGIVGAACALLFPNWSYCPPLTWPVVCGFTEHALIIAFIAMLLAGSDFKPRIRDAWMPAALLAAYAPIVYVFNKAHDTNYLFINTPSPGSPMMPAADAFGNPGCLVPLALAAIGSFLLMHALWQVDAHRRAVREARETSETL